MSTPLTAIRGGPLDDAKTDASSDAGREPSDPGLVASRIPSADSDRFIWSDGDTRPLAAPETTSAEDILASIDRLLDDQLADTHIATASAGETASIEVAGDDQWRRQFLSALRSVDHGAGSQPDAPRDEEMNAVYTISDVGALTDRQARALPVPYAHKDAQDIAPLDRSRRIAQTWISASQQVSQHRHLALMMGTGAALTGVLLAALPQIASLSAPAMPAVNPTETASASAQGTVASQPPIVNTPVLVREGSAGAQALDAFTFAPSYMTPRLVQSLRVEEPARILSPAPATTSSEMAAAPPADASPSPPPILLDQARLNELLSEPTAKAAPAAEVPTGPQRAVSAPRTSSFQQTGKRHEKPAPAKPAARSTAANRGQWQTPRQGLQTTPTPEPSTLSKLIGTVWPPAWPGANSSTGQANPQDAQAATPSAPVYSWSDMTRPEP